MLTEILKTQYPNINFFKDCIIEDRLDGKGHVIKYWNTEVLGPKPTKTQLKNWAEDLQVLKQVNNNKVLEKRKREYGTWREQLDKLYHDMKNGTTTWVGFIDSVRNANPLDE